MRFLGFALLTRRLQNTKIICVKTWFSRFWVNFSNSLQIYGTLTYLIHMCSTFKIYIQNTDSNLIPLLDFPLQFHWKVAPSHQYSGNRALVAQWDNSRQYKLSSPIKNMVIRSIRNPRITRDTRLRPPLSLSSWRPIMFDTHTHTYWNSVRPSLRVSTGADVYFIYVFMFFFQLTGFGLRHLFRWTWSTRTILTFRVFFLNPGCFKYFQIQFFRSFEVSDFSGIIYFTEKSYFYSFWNFNLDHHPKFFLIQNISVFEFPIRILL